MENLSKTYFGTGCFWGAERKFWLTKGVVSTSVGYMGGTTAEPSYQEVCTGRTGHAEVVEVTFDPKLVSYRELLALFWVMHDPTSFNRQGNDVGSQYRSAIFFSSDEQENEAYETLGLYQSALDKSGYGKICTEISNAADFTYSSLKRRVRRPYIKLMDDARDWCGENILSFSVTFRSGKKVIVPYTPAGF